MVGSCFLTLSGWVRPGVDTLLAGVCRLVCGMVQKDSEVRSNVASKKSVCMTPAYVVLLLSSF